MRKVGVIWIGHSDYLDRNTAAVVDAADACLHSLPFVCSKMQTIATTEEEVVGNVRQLVGPDDCCGAIIVLATWVECNVVMAALKELRGRPCMLWGFPLEEVGGICNSTGSYVSATMLAGVVKRLSLLCPMLFASWKDPHVAQELSCFTSAAAAVDALFYAKIGLIGYTSMSIYTGTFDHVLLRWMIGPEAQQMDTYSLIRAAEQVPQEKIEAASARLKQLSCCKGDVSDEMLHKTMALYVALRQLCEQNNWQAVNVKCQYELSKEYKVVPCVALSLLAEDGITASCEGDMLCTVSMLLLQALSQQTVWYGDSLTHTGNIVQFSPCGFLPMSMANGKPAVQKFMEHPGFSGIQVNGVLRAEKITFVRLVEDVGSYHLVYGTGQGKPTKPRGGCMPALDVELDGSIEDLCRAYAGQHYAVAYGDLSRELEMYAQLMGIRTERV